MALDKNRKILYTANSDIHLNTFHKPYLKWLSENGFEVHIACENKKDIIFDFADKIHYIKFERFPLKLKNIGAIYQLRNIIKSEVFSAIHCHTPTVSVLTRIAAFFSKQKDCKVLYTAHGYHFYKNGPLLYWLSFYPIEWILSKITDVIILINREDYEITERRFLNSNTYQIKGIGVDIDKFKPLSEKEVDDLRKENGLNKNDFVLIYVAEFIERKNHRFLLYAVKKLKAQISNLKVLLVGTGVLKKEIEAIASKLDLNDTVIFKGWRDDVHLLSAIADIGISTSKQEGLGLGLAEQMACKVPIVASQDRGHKEMVIHGSNGYLFPQNDEEKFVEYIFRLYVDKALRESFAEQALITSKSFSLENSLNMMAKIYKKHIC
jgi:glycosyltransferase EpsD